MFHKPRTRICITAVLYSIYLYTFGTYSRRGRPQQKSQSLPILTFPYYEIQVCHLFPSNICSFCPSTSLMASLLHSALQSLCKLILITCPNHCSESHFTHSTTPQCILFDVAPTHSHCSLQSILIPYMLLLHNLSTTSIPDCRVAFYDHVCHAYILYS